MIGHMSEKIRFKFAEDAESYGGKRKRYVPAQKHRKEKNGKEIYETDLIQHMDPVTLETLTSEVYWNEKGYWAVRDKNGKFVDLLHRTELPEVIGNIYENPHL